MNLIDYVKNKFNAFNKRDPTEKDQIGRPITYAVSNRPDRFRFSYGNERTIINSVFSKIAVDVSQIKMEVVKTNENGQYVETITDSGLNNILTRQANIDQSSRAFVRDIVMSMLDEGVVAVVPIDTEDEIYNSEVHDYDIITMRVGKITQWYPKHVLVNVYDDNSGIKKDLKFRKDQVCIIENPFYSLMNEPNSTLKRLCLKLQMLDAVDQQTSSGKLDIIIQLPYAVKSDIRQSQANQRRQDIEDQLIGSKYGIAYIDGTEHITQLNRPAENNLLSQIEYLTNMLYSQLGITQSILDGTADEQTMNNYYERTIEPIITAITEGLTNAFITKTAYTQGKRVTKFNDPFRFVPTSKLPDLADKLIRNTILTPNEFRSIIGYKPSEEENADSLQNPNINQNGDESSEYGISDEEATEGYSDEELENEVIDEEEVGDD